MRATRVRVRMKSLKSDGRIFRAPCILYGCEPIARRALAYTEPKKGRPTQDSSMPGAHALKTARRLTACGLSMVELLVGLAIGLFILAGGLSLFASQSRFSVETSLEAQVQRNLRQALDFATQDLRRAGAWENAQAGAPATLSGHTPNPHASLLASNNELSYSYGQDRAMGRTSSFNQANSDEQFGLRLRDGVLESAQGSGLWQALTDSRAVKITGFTVTPTASTVDARDVCAAVCCDQINANCSAVNAPQGCPKVQRWTIDLTIEGESRRDPSIRRRVDGRVQVRNEFLSGRCPG